MRSRRLLESLQADLRRLRSDVRKLGRQTGSADPAEPDAPSRPGLVRTPIQYEAELAELAAQLEAIRESESYRLGHAIVRTVRSPITTLRRGFRRRASETAPRRRARRPGAPRVRAGPRMFPLPEPAPTIGPIAEDAQTTMFVVWGPSPEDLERLVGEVAKLQVMLRDFKPLFVTDSESWSAFKTWGYWFEHVISAREWGVHNDPDEWPRYISDRMAAIVDTYAPDAVVVYELGGGGELLRSGALNGIVGRGLPRPEEAPRPRLHQSSG